MSVSRSTCATLAALLVVAAPAPAAFADTLPPAERQAVMTVDPSVWLGDWSGELKADLFTLGISFELTRGPDGAWSGVMNVPMQGVKGMPLDRVVVSGDTVQWEMAKIQGHFEGRLEADGKTITGKWTQSGRSLPLRLTHNAAPVVLVRPQTPKPPFPYVSEDVTYANPRSGFTLAGTLTKPKGQGPFPVALLITGSGPQDRDETIFGHKPYFVLADALTRRGVAVLRVDDRGVGQSTGDPVKATSADFAEDVRAGMRYLQGRSDIDRRCIGLLGHSEGGLITSLVAAGNPDVAFVVMLAGPGLPGDQIVLRQKADIFSRSGLPEAQVAADLATDRQAYAILAEEADDVSAARRIRAIYAGRQPKPADKELDAAIAQLLSPWFRFFLKFDPRPSLAQVTCPVLAINGALDLQVAAQPNLEAIGAQLKRAGNRDVTLRTVPDVNHLLQTAKTGLPGEYAQIEETIAPGVLATIVDWVAARTGQRP